jgi:hypothetical protein
VIDSRHTAPQYTGAPFSREPRASALLALARGSRLNAAALGRLAIGLAAALLLAPAAAGQGKGGPIKKNGDLTRPKEETLDVQDELKPGLPTDPGRPPGCYRKVYKYRMTAGTTYTIDMMRADGGGQAAGQILDPYLRLEDPSGRQVAKDDDGGGNQNARIIYRAEQTGTHRIIATSFGADQRGRYRLSARPGGTVPVAGGPAGGFPAMLPPGMSPHPEHAFGDIVVRQEPGLRPGGGGGISVNEFTHGYATYRFTVRNTSKTATHRVTLKVPRGEGSWSGPFLRALTRTVKELGPGDTATVVLSQPDVMLASGYGGGLEILIDGQASRETMSVDLYQSRGQRYAGMYYGGGRGELLLQILTAPNLVGVLQGNLFKAAIGVPPGELGHSSRGSWSGVYEGTFANFPNRHAFQQAATSPAAWDTDWLAYSGFDGIVLPADYLEAASADVRRALWRYAECGGSLVILAPQGKAKVPAAWRRTRTRKDGLTCYYPGFGECLVLGPDPGAWSPAQWRRVTRSWDTAAQPWQHVRSLVDANADFPVVANLGTPVRGLFALMLLFGIGIGPVNLYLLSRKKRRIWMLWTVPAISLVTCLTVLGYMAVSEGWTRHRRAQALTVLDENAGRATTVGWVGYYTPLAPSDGLHFSPQTELTPQLASEGYRGMRAASPRTLDWTDEQHLASGWLTARVPAYFAVRKTAPERQQLALHRLKGGGLEVANFFKADVRRLWLADRDGQVYTAADVPAGGKAALKPGGQVAGGGPGVLRELYGKNWLLHYRYLTERPQEYLRPGCYLAELDDTPFLEEGLRGAVAHESRSVVYGILKGDGDAR